MKRFLGVVALAAMLAISGCAGHRAAGSGLSTDGNAAQSGTTTPATTPATTTGTGSTSASTTATIASVEQQLAQVNSTLAQVDGNITQADKAADSDN